MVRLITTAIFSIFSVATLALSAPSSHTHTQRSADSDVQISADLNNIGTRVDTLKTTAAQAKNINDALACHQQAIAISNLVSKTKNDVNANGKISQADGADIINSSKELASKVNGTITTFINRKSFFNGLGLANVNQLFVNDFKDLGEQSDNLWSVVIGDLPVDFVVAATNIRNEMHGSFASGISVYSSG